MHVTARTWRALAVVGGALMLMWPAFWSGYPLLYPDSMSYLGDGRQLARIVFLHAPKGYSAMRSEIYSLGIFLLHWNISAWPVIAFHALLTACILWLAVRSFRRDSRADTILPFLLLVAGLSLTTSLAWYTSVVLPDILGPVLYLAIYLLVFARENLSTKERWAVLAIAWWAIAAHSTHLMLAVWICGFLAVLLVLRWPPLRGRGRALAAVVALVVFTAASQMALHGYLYGKPSLYGNRMPYLTARVVADGPGRWFLREHCGQLRWAICAHVGNLPDNDDDFLWGDTGVWATSPPAAQQQMLREETPLVVAAVREYPKAQFQRSLANFWGEFTDFGLWDFGGSSWIDHELDKVLPGAKPTYLRTRQGEGTLPNVFFSGVQDNAVTAAAVLLAIGIPMLWWWRRWQILGLVAVIVPTVVVNAMITAVLSESDSRYQSRVIWLIPLTAAFLLIDTPNCRQDLLHRSVNLPTRDAQGSDER